MKIDRMRRPRSRDSFERNLHLLCEQVKDGRMRFAAGIEIGGMLRVRTLPNGRIDMLSVDEMTRLNANTAAQFADFPHRLGRRGGSPDAAAGAVVDDDDDDADDDDDKATLTTADE